jgi:O-acetyl-ADP-ribose deacetylase (regulator of RNase III)
MAKTREYQFGHSRLILIFGDIIESEAQVIVSSDDYYLSMAGGVSAAIHRAGGDSIAQDAAKKVPAQLGDVIVTGAGALPAEYIFHAVTIGPAGQTLPVKQMVSGSISKCLRLLDVMGLRSIAFPAIGTGVAQLPIAEVAVSMAESIAQFASDSQLRLHIELYLLDRFGQRSEMDYAAFFEEFAQRMSIARAAAVPKHASAVPIIAFAPLTEEDQQKQRRNHVRQLLAKLEEQRQKIEEKLVDHHISGDEGALVAVRGKLADNELLRLNYLAELREIGQTPTQGLPVKGSGTTIFLSSTYRDLTEYRLKVKDEIHKLRLEYSGMEWFGADGSAPPAAKVLESVRACDVYVGVVGVRYGSINDATGESMTELEYQTAVMTGKRIHMYLLHDDAPITSGMIESDPTGYAKLQIFKASIKKKHTVFFFKSAEELARQVASDLRIYC